MPSLDDYAAFVATLEQGSLTGAARQLGRSLQSVSRALGALERELGVELVHRTTRRLRPTDAGAAFQARLKAALADIASARDELVDRGARLAGRLRVGASTQFGPIFVMPVLTQFMERHPDLEVELTLGDAPVDLLEAGLDLVVRIGALADSSMKARRIGEVRRVVFGTPAYLAARGLPQRPADLARHDCILRLRSMPSEVWRFGDETDPEEVEVRGRFRSDSSPARVAAAAAGLGIGLAPLYQVQPLLSAGRIRLVLADRPPAPVPVHLVWPAAAVMPNRTRALVDFMAARLSLIGS